MAKAQTAARSPGRDAALKIVYLNATAGGAQFQIVLARHREAEQGGASLRKAEEVEQAGIFFEVEQAGTSMAFSTISGPGWSWLGPPKEMAANTPDWEPPYRMERVLGY